MVAYETTGKQLEKEYNFEELEKITNMERTFDDLKLANKSITNQRKMVWDIYHNPLLKGEEKREMIDIIYGEMIETARYHNELYDMRKSMGAKK